MVSFLLSKIYTQAVLYKDYVSDFCINEQTLHYSVMSYDISDKVGGWHCSNSSTIFSPDSLTLIVSPYFTAIPVHSVVS